MITQECRPRTFEEVAGQDLVKNVLKAIIKNPEESPKTIILQGEYGTGKTTCARILARALNCKHSKNGDACGKCDFCKSNIDNTVFYEEFDSAIIGNVETIKSLRDTFFFDKDLGYKVIVLDEAQLMTPQAQSALLKVLEESNTGVFFVLCTTHIDKLLPTICSRSLKLRFNLISEQEIKTNILNIAEKKGVSPSEETIDLITKRCGGHLRDAHMLLDQYLLLGDEVFLQSVPSASELYYKLLLNILKKDLATANTILGALQKLPLYTLKQDYEQMILDILKVGIGASQTTNKYLAFLVAKYKDKIFAIVDILNRKVIYDMFTSDKRFQAAMYILIKDLAVLKV